MAESPQNFRRAACNLLGLIVIGLSVSWWVLYFTDYFPVVLGLLGLGGFFAWIAFVINILSEGRRNQLQQRFDEVFLQKKWSLVLIIMMLLIGWLGALPLFGTLIVDSLEPIEGHVAEIRAADSHKSELKESPLRAVLPPRSKAKILLFTNWFGSRDYYVKISGLPSRRVTISGMRRYTLLVPTMLWERPVILVRPEARFSGGPVASGFSLQILLNNKLVAQIKDFKGQSVWIGADDDVVPPERLLDQWRREFIQSKMDTAGISRWAHPVGVAPALELPPGAEVTAQLVLRSEVDSGNPTVRYSNTLKVSTSGKARSFPEELVLREVKDDRQ